MHESDTASPTEAAGDDARLAPLFVAIVLVEVLTIASLYWFSRHFS